jgi:hypothetical protein
LHAGSEEEAQQGRPSLAVPVTLEEPGDVV